MAGHGGAWKVAYADFVTAMMALFMVLWISAQDKRILIATSKYFQSPFTSPLNANSGLMPFNKDANDTSSAKTSDSASGKEKPTDKTKQVELNFLNSVAADFYRLLHLDENPDQKPVDVQVTSDGLKLTLFNRPKAPIFVGDTAEFTDLGRSLMQSLAWIVERHKFRVAIDGHTARSALPDSETRSGWDISADRANAARRALVHYAVDPGQIERVTGYSDTRPLEGEKPESPANHRVAISLALTSKFRDESRPPTTAPAH